MSEKQDRQGVRKASDVEQKYNLGQSLDKAKGAVVAATRAANSANAAANRANMAAETANMAAETANAAAEEMRQFADFVIDGTVTADGQTVKLDKSFTEILQAARQKRKCSVIIGGDSLNVFELVFASDWQIRFQQLTQEGVLVSLEVSPGGEVENL